MKHSVILLLLLWFCTGLTNDLLACDDASQHRLFPVGETPEGLCVVETHLHRTFDREGSVIELGWKGVSYFKIYGPNYKEIYTEVLDTLKSFEDKNYHSVIAQTFHKGLQLGKSRKNFVAAKPISINFCNYQTNCSKAKVSFNVISNEVYVQLTNNKKYPVKVLSDSTSIASNVARFYIEEYAELSMASPYGQLYLNSVRQFIIGGKKLTVVHLAHGELRYSPSKKASFAFTDLHKSVFEEPVIYHEDGFDFYIWE